MVAEKLPTMSMDSEWFREGGFIRGGWSLRAFVCRDCGIVTRTPERGGSGQTAGKNSLKPPTILTIHTTLELK